MLDALSSRFPNVESLNFSRLFTTTTEEHHFDSSFVDIDTPMLRFKQLKKLDVTLCVEDVKLPMHLEELSIRIPYGSYSESIPLLVSPLLTPSLNLFLCRRFHFCSFNC